MLWFTLLPGLECIPECSHGNLSSSGLDFRCYKISKQKWWARLSQTRRPGWYQHKVTFIMFNSEHWMLSTHLCSVPIVWEATTLPSDTEKCCQRPHSPILSKHWFFSRCIYLAFSRSSYICNYMAFLVFCLAFSSLYNDMGFCCHCVKIFNPLSVTHKPNMAFQSPVPIL